MSTDGEDRYHVHLRSRRGMRRAWEFNLTADRLQREVVGPWLSGSVMVFGDRDWEPRESELRIFRGPHLEPADLALGQGPASAERTAANVTRDVLAGAGSERRADAADAAASSLIDELRGLDGVSIENAAAQSVVAERLRALGLGG